MALQTSIRVTTATPEPGHTATLPAYIHTPRHLEVDAITSLTRRELEVLALICHRLTDSEIADVLSISTRTVECHVTRILGKLQTRNRRDAAALAGDHGLARMPTIVQLREKET